MNRLGRTFAMILAVFVALALYFGTGKRGLRTDFALQSALMRHAAVTTLRIGSAGEIPMFLNPADGVITRQILAGLFEPSETTAITESLRPGDTFVDVGANVGYYTLIAARVVGSEGRVFAFEPDPEAAALLERSVLLNGFENVVLERKAVSNEPGSIRLYLAEKNKGDHRIYPTEEPRDFIEVEAVTLDDYFANDPGRIDFVKIDVQGADLAVLEGMSGLIEANPEILLSVEFWPFGLRGFGDEAKDMLDFLLSRDFRLFDLRAGEASPEGLLRTYGMSKHRFTNLLTIKGRAEVERLRSEARRWQSESEQGGSETARVEFDRVLARLRALQPGAPTFPHRP